MKLILFCLIILPLFSVAQQTATINVTPNLNSVAEYQKIVASADGKSIFLIGKKEKELVTLKNDGIYWKNIPVKNVLNYIDDALIQTQGYVWAYNYHKVYSDLFTLGSDFYWHDYKLREKFGIPITAMGTSRKKNDILLAGKIYDRGTAYAASYSNAWTPKWTFLTAKKSQPEIDQLFETNTISKVQVAIKKMCLWNYSNPTIQL
ncbi:MAG: hypothetical protein V9E96_10980 [Chitinophagaceae bacterium]